MIALGAREDGGRERERWRDRKRVEGWEEGWEKGKRREGGMEGWDLALLVTVLSISRPIQNSGLSAYMNANRS